MSDEDDNRLIALLRDTKARDGLEPAPAALSSRILTDFEAVSARCSQWRLSRLVETIWPGAPAWKPAAALGLSLMIGLGVGALLPVYGPVDETSVASDAGLDFGGDLR
jgi:hypothetical protein